MTVMSYRAMGRLSFGTSLNGLGKAFTVMVAIEPPVSDDIRGKFESLWADAEPLQQPRDRTQATGRVIRPDEQTNSPAPGSEDNQR